jgi:tripartite-type tricarboxylate transporter receptor subunit TctC
MPPDGHWQIWLNGDQEKPMKLMQYIIVILVAAIAPIIVCAQEYPIKPIVIIVPFPPGGFVDVIARTVGQQMSKILKQQVVVENRSGAGGVLGTALVARAEADGYTIGITSAGAFAISASVQSKIPYDAITDFKGITLLTKMPELLVVSANVPVSNLHELVALAKDKPGQLNFASSGVGSMPHLAGELLKFNAHINIVHVPYRGAAPAITDLLAGHVQMAFLDLPILLPQVRAQTLKAIAVSSKSRADLLKDVPTTAEAGYPQIDAENWVGLVAPAATPPAIIAKLNHAAVEALRSSVVRQRLISEGAILVGDTPEEFSAYVKNEKERWAKVAKTAGIERQ